VAFETAIKPPVSIKDIIHSKSIDPQTTNQSATISPDVAPSVASPDNTQTTPLADISSDVVPSVASPQVEPQQQVELLPTKEEVKLQITNDTLNNLVMEEDLDILQDDPDLPADRILQEEEAGEQTTQEELQAFDDLLVVHELQEDENKTEVSTLSPFHQAWITMCDTILKQDKVIYHPFKENIPQYENLVITIVVSNGIVEDFFKDKKREILSYMRNNFDDKIEDIVLDIQKETVQKKYLLSNREQADLLHQQNREFSDFVNLLELKLIE